MRRGESAPFIFRQGRSRSRTKLAAATTLLLFVPNIRGVILLQSPPQPSRMPRLRKLVVGSFRVPPAGDIPSPWRNSRHVPVEETVAVFGRCAHLRCDADGP